MTLRPLNSAKRLRWIAVNLLWLLCLISSSATGAEGIVTWPQLTPQKFPYTSTPKLARNGQLLAVQVGYFVQVWTVQTDGQLGRLLWNSREADPSSLPVGFTWWNQDLVLSKVKDQQGRSIAALSEYEIYRLERERGDTLLLDPITGRTRPLLDHAYTTICASERDGYLAVGGATERSKNQPETGLRFYQRDLPTNRLRLIGQLERNVWTILIGWSHQPDGLYLFSPDERKSPDEWARKLLLFVTPDGKSQEVLPPNASMLRNSKDDPPKSTLVAGGRVAAYISYFDQVFAYALVDRDGILQRVTDGEVARALNRKQDEFQPLALSPNGRFMLVQETQSNSRIPRGQAMIVWAFDWRAKRRRRLGMAGRITEVYGWSGDKLTVNVAPPRAAAPVDDAGVISFPEGNLPPDSPQLKAAVARAPWEDATPHKPPRTQTETETAIEKFLGHPDVVPVPVPDVLRRASSAPKGWEQLTTYRLSTSPDTQSLIALDPKSNRVVAFVGPPLRPPLPPEPIAPERAREVAQAFARVQQPEFFKTEGQVQTKVESQITPHATYVVHLQRPQSNERDLARVTIEVRASDGKVAAYADSVDITTNKANEKGLSTDANAIVDQTPTWSPNSQQIAFLSNRPREGYPLWWKERPLGLYVMDADGRGLHNVAIEASGPAHWSPDGKRLAVQQGAGIYVYDLANQARVMVPSPRDALIEPRLFGWLNAQQLLLGWVHHGPGGCDLVTWQPTLPQQPPTVIVKEWSKQVGNSWGAGSFALSGDGKRLYFSWLNLNDIGNPCPYALYLMPVSDLKSKPIKVSACLPVGASVQWNATGVFVADNDKTVVVDRISGQVQEWQVPEELRRIGRPATRDIQMSPDGRYLAFAARVQDSEDANGSAYEIHVAQVHSGSQAVK